MIEYILINLTDSIHSIKFPGITHTQTLQKHQRNTRNANVKRTHRSYSNRDLVIEWHCGEYIDQQGVLRIEGCVEPKLIEYTHILNS